MNISLLHFSRFLLLFPLLLLCSLHNSLFPLFFPVLHLELVALFAVYGEISFGHFFSFVIDLGLMHWFATFGFARSCQNYKRLLRSQTLCSHHFLFPLNLPIPPCLNCLRPTQVLLQRNFLLTIRSRGDYPILFRTAPTIFRRFRLQKSTRKWCLFRIKPFTHEICTLNLFP